MGNFQNVTIGAGALEIDGVDAGYIKGNVTFSYVIDENVFNTGVPQMRRGSIVTTLGSKLTVPLGELTADNIAAAMGGLTPTTTAASEVNLTGSYTAVTATLTKGFGTLYIVKLGPSADMQQKVTLSTGGDAPVLYNVAETTAYVEDDDYSVDYASGNIIMLPSGTNYANFTGDNYVVHAKWKYTPTASKQINMGASYAITDVTAKFTHTRPSGKEIIVYYPKANIKNVEVPFNETDWNVNTIEINSVYDESSATFPMGYIWFET